MGYSRRRGTIVVAPSATARADGPARGDRVVVPLGGAELGDLPDDLGQRVDVALEAGPRTLLVDMSTVGRISSSTVAALLDAKRRCSSRGVGVLLQRPSRRCVAELGRAGLLGVLAVEPDDGESRSALRPARRR